MRFWRFLSLPCAVTAATASVRPLRRLRHPMWPTLTNAYYERFVEGCRNAGLPVETGIFRAHMLVELVNNGPVTILLDSTKLL